MTIVSNKGIHDDIYGEKTQLIIINIIFNNINEYPPTTVRKHIRPFDMAGPHVPIYSTTHEDYIKYTLVDILRRAGRYLKIPFAGTETCQSGRRAFVPAKSTSGPCYCPWSVVTYSYTSFNRPASEPHSLHCTQMWVYRS